MVVVSGLNLKTFPWGKGRFTNTCPLDNFLSLCAVRTQIIPDFLSLLGETEAEERCALLLRKLVSSDTEEDIIIVKTVHMLWCFLKVYFVFRSS